MMSWAELSQLEWAHPLWAMLALQPVLMMLLLKLRRNQVLHYADVHLRPWAMRNNMDLESKQGRWREVFNYLAWVLLASALAGPRIPLMSDQAHQQAIQSHQLDVMVLLDVSPSMLAQDVSPQRLQPPVLGL